MLKIFFLHLTSTQTQGNKSSRKTNFLWPSLECISRQAHLGVWNGFPCFNMFAVSQTVSVFTPWPLPMTNVVLFCPPCWIAVICRLNINYSIFFLFWHNLKFELASLFFFLLSSFKLLCNFSKLYGWSDIHICQILFVCRFHVDSLG